MLCETNALSAFPGASALVSLPKFGSSEANGSSECRELGMRMDRERRAAGLRDRV
jgi:hypothetical protein